MSGISYSPETMSGPLYVTSEKSKPKALQNGVPVTGSAYFQGPVQMGIDDTYDAVEATVMIGNLSNNQTSTPDNALYVRGNTTHEGDYEHTGDMTQKGNYVHNGDVRHVGDSTHLGCFTVSTPPGCDSEFNGNIRTTGWVRADQDVQAGTFMDVGTDITVANDGTFGGTVTATNFIGTLNGQSNGAIKAFDIPHPTKEGWRLRHVCVEGPSADVYYRGRVRSKTEIQLPHYWEKLVDPTTITVSLTPIGSHQDVIVKRIGDGKIYLQSKGGMPIDCFYHIYAERIDGERLIAEYEGTSPEDYPGDNSAYSVAGFHYDKRA